jgi:hypothetical protein
MDPMSIHRQKNMNAEKSLNFASMEGVTLPLPHSLTSDPRAEFIALKSQIKLLGPEPQGGFEHDGSRSSSSSRRRSSYSTLAKRHILFSPTRCAQEF